MEIAPLAPLNPEVLYITPTYQVCLRRLTFGQPLFENPPAQSGYNALLVEGEAFSKSNRETIVRPGYRFDANTAKAATYQLNSKQGLLLEIVSGSPKETLALPDVTEVRPWGSFTVLKDEPNYKLKQLLVKSGKRLSLQRHQKREEHWFVTNGQPEVTLDDRKIPLATGDYILIPLHSWHRIANPASESTEQSTSVEIIELQLGDYFGEDDIERCQDDYGRV
jgi:mannose-6-phosphate isomerase